MGRKPNIDLTGSTSDHAVSQLRQIVFTAAHDWKRAIYIDQVMRDMIVEALRARFVRSADGQS